MPAVDIILVGGVGFRDGINLSVKSCGDIKGVRIIFEPFKEFNKKKEIILIIFFIFSSKFLSINLFNNIINNFKFFIIIIIFLITS